MKIYIKKFVFVFSLILNIIFLLLIVLSLTKKTSFFAFLNLYPFSTLHSAVIVSVPTEESNIEFGAVEFYLKRGSEAALQYSAIREGRPQSNLAIEPLYDRSIISIEQTGFGLLIHALNPGEAALQLFTPSGFKNIAKVYVYE
jgi:hypothetical protein